MNATGTIHGDAGAIGCAYAISADIRQPERSRFARRKSWQGPRDQWQMELLLGRRADIQRGVIDPHLARVRSVGLDDKGQQHSPAGDAGSLVRCQGIDLLAPSLAAHRTRVHTALNQGGSAILAPEAIAKEIGTGRGFTGSKAIPKVDGYLAGVGRNGHHLDDLVVGVVGVAHMGRCIAAVPAAAIQDGRAKGYPRRPVAVFETAVAQQLSVPQRIRAHLNPHSSRDGGWPELRRENQLDRPWPGSLGYR